MRGRPAPRRCSVPLAARRWRARWRAVELLLARTPSNPATGGVEASGAPLPRGPSPRDSEPAGPLAACVCMVASAPQHRGRPTARIGIPPREAACPFRPSRPRTRQAFGRSAFRRSTPCLLAARRPAVGNLHPFFLPRNPLHPPPPLPTGPLAPGCRPSEGVGAPNTAPSSTLARVWRRRGAYRYRQPASVCAYRLGLRIGGAPRATQ